MHLLQLDEKLNYMSSLNDQKIRACRDVKPELERLALKVLLLY